MDDDQELRARIEAQVAARRPTTPSSTSEAGQNDAGEREGSAEPDERPGHLTPIRPWLLQGATPSAPSAAPTPKLPSAGRPVAQGGPEELPRPLDPPRPWLKQSRPAEPPSGPAVPQPAGERSRVLDPTRPWLAQKLESPQAPAVNISPRPSDSASVLEPLVAEIQAAADGAAGGRRGIFRRRRAAEQAPSPASLEPRHAVAPGQVSWPITFESDEIAASAFRVLGEPTAMRAPAPADRPSGEPVDGTSAFVGPEDPMDAGRLRKAAHWLFEQAPEPADELSTPAGGPSVVEQVQPEAGGVLHGLFHRRSLGAEDEPAVVALPPRMPMRPTVAWNELRTRRSAEQTEESVPVAQAPQPVEPAAPEPVAEAAPEPAVVPQAVRPRPRPYASAPRLDADAPRLAGTTVPEPRLVARAAALQPAGASASLGTGRDQPQKLDKGGPDRTRKNLRWLVRTGITLLIVVIAAVLLRVFVVAPYFIPSASMEPTLHGCNGCNNDHVLVDKLSYRMHDIHRGDVVVFNRPSTWQVSEKTLVKRVVGLPGDTLKVSDGKLFVNGLEIEEPYVNSKCAPMSTLAESPAQAAKTFGPIPANEVYVMGDNRCDSSDSRAFGPVPDSKVIGRAFVIIWPLGRIHYL